MPLGYIRWKITENLSVAKYEVGLVASLFWSSFTAVSQ